jgi:exodeoxyribonuclease VII large subunit
MAKESPSLFDPPGPGSNLPEFTVAELSSLLKRRIEEDFGQVRVRGEVTGAKLHSSGHLYLNLKDENAVLAAVCWRGQVAKLKIRPEEGMEVVATGRLTTYPGQSKYQIVIESLALAGVGALLKMLEDRRKKLAAEGLFDEARKKKIPFLPEVIGVITSPTGAVIQDILHRLEERFPRRVLLWPVPVQGDNAAAQIASAIAGFNALEKGGAIPRPDVLIVARGGGSLEDMLPFYEEVVVRAAAASRIPLISAVGHETDTTMIDFAADRRAPTPTAAAEMAVPVRLDLLASMEELGLRIKGAMRGRIETAMLHLRKSAAALRHPRFLIETLTQRLDERSTRLVLAIGNGLGRRQQHLHKISAGLSLRPLQQHLGHCTEKTGQLGEKLDAAFNRVVEKRLERLGRLSELLKSYSYQGVLERGFALVRDSAGVPVMRAAEIKPGQDLSLSFADGGKKVRAG